MKVNTPNETNVDIELRSEEVAPKTEESTSLGTELMGASIFAGIESLVESELSKANEDGSESSLFAGIE